LFSDRDIGDTKWKIIQRPSLMGRNLRSFTTGLRELPEK
jgi:hypothetical protein